MPPVEDDADAVARPVAPRALEYYLTSSPASLRLVRSCLMCSPTQCAVAVIAQICPTPSPCYRLAAKPLGPDLARVGSRDKSVASTTSDLVTWGVIRSEEEERRMASWNTTISAAASIQAVSTTGIKIHHWRHARDEEDEWEATGLTG